MSPQIEHCHLDNELTLRESSELPLTVRAVSLVLTKQNDKISECRLTFQVSPELYQHIDTQALFNLKPEIRTPLSGGTFQPSLDIQVETSLDPALLPKLAEQAKDANQTAAYLQTLSQEQPNHPILSPYSWYGLRVKQQQEKGETGYQTLWLYLKPSDISPNGINSEKMNEAMFNFAKDWANRNQSEMSEEFTSQAVDKMTKTLEELTNKISEMTQEVVSETFEEMASVFEEMAESISELTEEIASEKDIFEELVNFFQKEDWQFQRIPGESTLRLAFQGKNGRWDCYAKVRKQQQQFAFYSICPINAPENKRMAIAEFITRANYGTIIGNFELDFTDGEIRYKTSIDVEGSNLTFPLIKRLVYANVTMMDEYLPGIVSVIEGDVEPKDAIAQIELIQPSSSSDLSSNLTDTQTPVTSPSPPEELTLNPGQQTAIGNPVSVQIETISDILSLLTREEIAQFHRSVQLEGTYQIKVAQTILSQLKSRLQARLGELGEQVFDRSYNLLKTRNLDSKSIKFIQRYAEIATKIRWLREESKRRDLSREITELSEISSLVEARLSQLTKDGLSGKEEIEMLIEIEELKRQLTDQENLLKS